MPKIHIDSDDMVTVTLVLIPSRVEIKDDRASDSRSAIGFAAT